MVMEAAAAAAKSLQSCPTLCDPIEVWQRVKLPSKASHVAQMVKNLPPSVGDTGNMGSIPGSERSLEVGNGNLLQYSCLENSIGRGTWHTIVHVAAELDSTEQLSMRVTCIFILSYFGQNRN